MYNTLFYSFPSFILGGKSDDKTKELLHKCMYSHITCLKELQLKLFERKILFEAAVWTYLAKNADFPLQSKAQKVSNQWFTS